MQVISTFSNLAKGCYSCLGQKKSDLRGDLSKKSTPCFVPEKLVFIMQVECLRRWLMFSLKENWCSSICRFFTVSYWTQHFKISQNNFLLILENFLNSSELLTVTHPIPLCIMCFVIPSEWTVSWGFFYVTCWLKKLGCFFFPENLLFLELKKPLKCFLP